MRYPFRLFEVAGLEIEYMIVDAATGDVRPVADAVLGRAAGVPVGSVPPCDVERGNITWSNDLALHLLELKTTSPARSLAGLAERYQREVAAANGLLAGMGARLLPGGVHPRMDPARELRLWPHENAEIYAALDRIFNCRRHGWGNLQSSQLNLPFGDDEEFGRLHAAVRLVLPLLPALAAASPFLDGRYTGWMDARLREYGANAERVASVVGRVVPERVFTQAAYEGELLAGIHRDMVALDPQGMLRYEWINARGAIARFDRGAIEIRVVDAQEAPAVDVAIAAATTAVVRAMVEERWLGYDAQRAWPEGELAAIMWSVARGGEQAVIDGTRYLEAFGYPGSRATARELWEFLSSATLSVDPAWESEWREPLERLLFRGCLARRMVRAVGETPSVDSLRSLERDLSACLAAGEMFLPD